MGSFANWPPRVEWGDSPAPAPPKAKGVYERENPDKAEGRKLKKRKKQKR